MNISEFRAWFEGFYDASIGSGPVPPHWKRLKAKVDELRDVQEDRHDIIRDMAARAHASNAADAETVGWLKGKGHVDEHGKVSIQMEDHFPRRPGFVAAHPGCRTKPIPLTGHDEPIMAPPFGVDTNGWPTDGDFGALKP